MRLVEFHTAAPAKALEFTYKADEFALVYRHSPPEGRDEESLADQISRTLGIRRDLDTLVTADTLVCVFSGRNQELVAINAYTNMMQWTVRPHSQTPKVAAVGRIHLADAVPGRQIDLGVVPTYAFAHREGVLEVSLTQRQGPTDYYRVSDMLIVGVRDGDLCSFHVEGLRLE